MGSALVIFHIFALTVLAMLTVHTLLNARAIRRLWPRAAGARRPSVSVLVPARNEATRIGACVEAWRTQDYLDYELVVLDDESTDDTRRRAELAANGARHVRVVAGGRLPDGWRGKTHACHRLREQARGETLVFADADVIPHPSTLAATVAALEALGGEALSALPSHRPLSPLLRTAASLQNWAAFTFVPAWVSSARRRPSLATLNGQFIAMSAAVYDAAGGFAAVRGSLAEDTAFGRRLVGLGHRVDLMDGAQLLTCRAYTRLADLWRANVRNLSSVLFGSSWLLLLTAAVLSALYVGPLVVLGLGVLLGHGGTLGWTWLPLAETAMAMSTRAFVEHRSRHGAWLGTLHPVSAALLVVMQCDAWIRARRGAHVEWRGRTYRITDEAA